MIIISENQKTILKKYKIDYNTDDINELLKRIDFEMTKYVDKNDEPLKDFLILEKIYDEIYDQN